MSSIQPVTVNNKIHKMIKARFESLCFVCRVTSLKQPLEFSEVIILPNPKTALFKPLYFAPHSRFKDKMFLGLSTSPI